MSKYQCTDIKKIIYCPFECNSLFWTPWFKRFFKVDGMEIMDKFSLQNMICMRIFLEEKSKENLQVELPEIHTLLSLQRSFGKGVIQLFSWIWKKIPKGKRKIHSVKSLFLITKKWKEEGRKTWKTGFNFFLACMINASLNICTYLHKYFFTTTTKLYCHHFLIYNGLQWLIL